jgi:hypothetical protein
MKYADILSKTDIPDSERIKNIEDPRVADKIYTWFNGKVSYVRALDTGIDIKYEGSRLQMNYGNFESFQILYSSQMSILQSVGYTRAYLRQGKQNVWLKSREASDFVFPDGSYSTAGINRWFTNPRKADFSSPGLLEYFTKGINPNCSCRKSKKIDWARFNSCECKEKILDRISTCSAKLATLIETLTKVDTVTVNGKETKLPRRGVTFVYFDLVGSGIGPASVALEAMGYERFKYPIKNEKGEPIKIDVTTTKIGIPQKPRYIPITDYAGQEKEIVRLVRDIINHPLNYQGDYVQVILGSRVTMLGLSFYHNVNIEIYDPWWNPAATYQARSRGIRATSHEEMLKQLRKNNENARVTVHIYQHAAIPLDIQTVKDKLIALLEDSKDADDFYTVQELANYLNFLAVGEIVPQLIPGIQYSREVSLVVPENKITNSSARRLNTNILTSLVEKNISEEVKKSALKYLRSIGKSEISPPSVTLVSEPNLQKLERDTEKVEKAILEPIEDNEDDESARAPRDQDEEIEYPEEINEENYPPSIEIRIYQDAEKKDRPIKMISRYMKRIAVDCELQQGRNLRPRKGTFGDIDFTPECDYQLCNYEPLYKAPEKPDTSTYDILYSSSKIESLLIETRDIISKGLDNSGFNLPQDPEYNNLVGRMALFELQQEFIPNKFGYLRNYRSTGGYLYPDTPLESFYASNLFISKQDDLSSIVTELHEDTDKIKKLRSITNIKELSELVENLQFESKISLIEQIIDDFEHDISATEKNIKTEKRVQPADSLILGAFYRYIFKSPRFPKDVELAPGSVSLRRRPSELINTLSASTRQRRGGVKGELSVARGSSRGSKSSSRSSTPSKALSPTNLATEDIVSRYMLAEVDPEILYIHILELLKPENAAYRKTKQLTKLNTSLKIYDTGRWIKYKNEDVWETGKWRDATPVESKIYGPVINILWNSRWPNEKIYGIKIPEAKGFRLITSDESTGKESKGSCEIQTKATLLNRLIELNYKPSIPETISEEEIGDALATLRGKSMYTLPPGIKRKGPEAERYKKLAARIILEGKQYDTNGYSKPDLCKLIKDQLKKENLYIKMIDWNRAGNIADRDENDSEKKVEEDELDESESEESEREESSEE